MVSQLNTRLEWMSWMCCSFLCVGVREPFAKFLSALVFRFIIFPQILWHRQNFFEKRLYLCIHGSRRYIFWVFSRILWATILLRWIPGILCLLFFPEISTTKLVTLRLYYLRSVSQTSGICLNEVYGFSAASEVLSEVAKNFPAAETLSETLVFQSECEFFRDTCLPRPISSNPWAIWLPTFIETFFWASRLYICWFFWADKTTLRTLVQAEIRKFNQFLKSTYSSCQYYSSAWPKNPRECSESC